MSDELNRVEEPAADYNLGDFFESSSERSRIKSEIVKKYFLFWAQVMTSTKKSGNIAYIDLYSGPGIYEDGTKSTPILILESAAQNQSLQNRLVSIFNDVNKKHAASLKEAVTKIQKIQKFNFQPQINNEVVGKKIAEQLSGFKLVPTLLFIDPWGYKGLTLELIGSVLKDWGCDCIFFFNYRRINAAINNSLLSEHVKGIFGEVRFEKLKNDVKGVSPEVRETFVLEALKEALKEIQGQYVVTFKFYDDEGTRTSHHLIYVTKNLLAYETMKEIMAPYSSKIIDGVSYFEFNPKPESQLALNLFPETPLKDLEKEILRLFAGKTMKMKDIYEQHHIDKLYIRKNYKDVLLILEHQKAITVNPLAEKRRKIKGRLSFGDDVFVTFPK